jgi:hypothetical protein
MTAFELAESLFDEAEREERAGDLAVLAERNADAERHYERVRECQQQAHSLLDQLNPNQPAFRVAG